MVEMHEISKNGNGQIIRLDTAALTVLAPQSTKKPICAATPWAIHGHICYLD